MSAGDLLSLFGGASGGTAIVFCVLFVTGQIFSKGAYDEMRADRDDWKRIAELERARAEAGVVAGTIVKDVMLSLRKELDG
jgi:hypothetical protein